MEWGSLATLDIALSQIWVKTLFKMEETDYPTWKPIHTSHFNQNVVNPWSVLSNKLEETAQWKHTRFNASMLSRKSTLTLRRVSCLITVMEWKLTRLSKRVETRLHKKLKFSLKRLIKRLLNRRRYNKQTLQRLRRLMSRFLLAQVRHQMSKMYSSEQPIRDLTHITLTYHLMRTTFLSLLLTVQT